MSIRYGLWQFKSTLPSGSEFISCRFFKFAMEKTTLMEIQEMVLATLKASEAPMKSAEIASKAGIEKAEVDKAIKKLKKEEKIISPKNCYYSAR